METSESEVWKQIPGIPYEASNHGRVRRTTGRILRSFKADRYGYHAVSISLDGWSKRMYVHELVAKAFLGERPTRHDIDHVNGDACNNTPENLEYVTHKSNAQRSLRVRRGESHPGAKVSARDVRQIRDMDAGGVSCLVMMEKFGIGRKTLYDIRTRKTWSHIP